MTKAIILETLKAHKSEFSKFGVTAICLFGSYIRNEQTAKSDIDLLIDFAPDKESYDNYMAAYDDFERIFSTKKVGLVTKNGLSKFIGPKILKEVVYV